MAKYVVRSGDTFSVIADRFETSLAALVAANSEVSDPDLIFPGQIVAIPGDVPGAGALYVVQSGDTLTAIANRFDVTLGAVKTANPQITDPNSIFTGQIVAIPGDVPGAGAQYVVQSGDTLTAIANRFDVTLGAVKTANPQITDPNSIFTGQIVAIPGDVPGAGAQYVVQSGDTLTAIANRFDVTLGAVKAANPQITDPDTIFTGQIITVIPQVALTRQNIWTLDQQDHWHPVIHAYALAVGVLQERSAADSLDPLGWQYQSDIHGTNVNPDNFRRTCQHGSWYFLPWHRMYLGWFERIIRAAIADLDDVDDETKQTWALPYWDYSSDDANRRRLPQAFLDTTLPDGVTPNPLRVAGRNINNGAALPAFDVDLTAALEPIAFTGTTGFAGGETGFSHSGAVAGPLEITPHGAVHVDVGGLMGGFNTAALDPIFWLHHANIDRLWEMWRSLPGRTNTTSAAWLSGVIFHFHDEFGAEVTDTAQEVVDTVSQLNYRYEDITPPADLGAAMIPTPEPDNPPELVGATADSVVLAGTTTAVTFGISEPEGPLAAAAAPVSRAFLRVEDATSAEPAGVTYRVYLNVPDDDPATDDAHYVGVASFFGVEETANPDNEHGGLRLTYDITALYDRLVAQGRWKDQVTVTFMPQVIEPPENPVELPPGEAAFPAPPGNVNVGRVSVFLQ